MKLPCLRLGGTIFLVLGGLLPWQASAQRPPVPATRTMFLDAKFEKVPTPAQAKYRREIVFSDSVGGEIRDYFISGQPYNVGHYEHVDKRVLHGTIETWYDNGQLQGHEEYAHGKREGETRLYYKTGEMKRRETYRADERTSGTCYRPDGTPLPFFEYMVLPRYSEGDGSKQAIVVAVSQRVRYPAAALRAGQVGKVMVTFVVSKKGKVTDAHVSKAAAPVLDAAALEAVRKLGRFTPGQFDGELAAVSFTVPISFAIQ